MPLRVFTLVPDLETGIFDDTELHEFSKNHQILSKKQDLYFYREQPMMVIFLEYRNKTKGTRYFQGKKKAGKPKVELTEGETNLYESLRRWRNDTAKSAGISPMNILHRRCRRGSFSFPNNEASPITSNLDSRVNECCCDGGHGCINQTYGINSINQR